MPFRQTVRRYYYLTKPGIVYGNAISAIAGYLVAARGHVGWISFAAMIAGTSLVIACGCVFNNYIDREIDRKMTRTSKRALAAGKISVRAAMIYAIGLGVAGFALLLLFTNQLTVTAGLIGLVFYVVIYGYAKRTSHWGTVVGSIPGAMPISAGYLAASGRLDACVLLLFLAMVCWQMPHFYAIAMFRLSDYKAAGLPVLPAVRSAKRTKLEIMIYIAAYAIICAGLSLAGCTGIIFIVGMVALNIVWLWKGFIGFRSNDDVVWARRMFRFSLLVLLLFSFLLSVDWLLV